VADIDPHEEAVTSRDSACSGGEQPPNVCLIGGEDQTTLRNRRPYVQCQQMSMKNDDLYFPATLSEKYKSIVRRMRTGG